MAAVLAAMLAATAAGVGAERRWGKGAERLVRRVMDALLYGLMPFVTFFVVARLHVTAAVGAGLAYGYVATGAAALAGWFVGTRVLRLERPAVGVLMLCGLAANCGYLGVPLVATLLGSGQLGAAVAWDTTVNGPMIFVFGFAIGAAFGTRAGSTRRQRVRAYLGRNPALIALILGLVVPDSFSPDPLWHLARVAAIAQLPIAFFVLGVFLMGEREDGALDFPPRMTPALATALGVRLLVAPAIVVALSLLLVGAPRAYLVESAMPCAINTVMIAHVYGLDVRLAAAAVAWSTAIVAVAAFAAGVLA
ncbi:MAG: AEC family transporter [Solirubrobacteraceae bacterium]